MPVLPARPFTIATQFGARRVIGALLLVLVAVGCLIGGIVWQGGEIKQILADEKLFAEGTEAAGVRVHGDETSHNFILNSYKLTVQYADEGGDVHDGNTEFDVLFGSIKNGSAVTLKYDPKDPKRFALSWAVEHTVGRWASAIFFLLMFSGVFGLGAFYVAVVTIRQLTDVRKIAERSDEHALELISVQPVHSNGKHTGNTVSFRFQATPTGPSKVFNQFIGATDLPLFTNAQQTHIVALVTPHAPDRPWLVRANLYPFVFSPEVAAEIRSKSVS